MTIPGETLGQELERDLASQPGVFGPVDDTHATAVESLDDGIVRNGLTDHLVDKGDCVTVESLSPSIFG